MTHQELMAEKAHEFFQLSKLVEVVLAHPLLSLGVVLGASAAYGCGEIAMRKGRNDRLWAALGLLFSVVPLIVLIALPSAEPSAQDPVAPHATA